MCTVSSFDIPSSDRLCSKTIIVSRTERASVSAKMDRRSVRFEGLAGDAVVIAPFSSQVPCKQGI
jgi:hypothetical protein